MQFLSHAHLLCGSRCLVSGCPVYTPRRFSGIPSRKPKSPPFIRWCRLPWAPTRLPLWVLPLRCWRWRRCRRVCPWISVVPPSSLAIDIVIEVSSSFELLILSLTSQRLLRFRQVSVLHFKALFWCNGKFWSLSKRLLRPILKRRIQCLAFLQPFGSRSCIVVSFKSDAIEKQDFLFANIVLRQWLSVSFLFVPPWKYHRMAAMFALSCFLKHLFRLVEHHLSFRDTMFWSSTGICRYDKARDWSKIAIGLLECCRTPRVLQISPTIAIHDPDFGKGIAIRTLMFCRILAKFEDLCVVHVVA